jgi:hypothetical protein
LKSFYKKSTYTHFCGILNVIEELILLLAESLICELLLIDGTPEVLVIKKLSEEVVNVL